MSYIKFTYKYKHAAKKHGSSSWKQGRKLNIASINFTAFMDSAIQNQKLLCSLSEKESEMQTSYHYFYKNKIS